MSPEAQDDEKELTDRSQSFEGFMKPIKLAEGDKVTQSFTKDEIERLIFKESSGNANAEVNNEKEHSLGLMQVGKLALDDVNKMYGTNYKFDDLRNADINREVGTNYLNILLKKYGNKELALAAYNYGMKNVGKDTNNDVQNFNNLPTDVQNYAKEILNIQIVEQPKTNTINPSGMMGK
jgi:soluble lytic murein transglycosylase-like protein